MQIIFDAYYSAERSFADKSKTLCLQSITRAANLRTVCDIYSLCEDRVSRKK